MKLLIAAVTFTATIGMLFLIGTGKSPKEEAAQIIEALKEENTNVVISTTPTPIKTIKQSSPSPQNSPISQSKTPTPTRTPTPAPAPTPSHTPSRTPTPTSTRTPTPVKTPTPTPSPINPSPSPTPSETPTPTATPMPSSPPQEVGQGFINITSITSPVEQNSTAQLNISTLPDAQCSIKVTLPSGNQSSAKGLEAKAADTSGNAAWSWKINWNTTPGTANIDITCSKDGQNFSKSLQMTIVER